MVTRSNRRLIVLFLGTVLLPCTVLSIISVRSIRQDQELAEKRSADERARSASAARQALLARLAALQSEAPGKLAAQLDPGEAQTVFASPIRLVAEVADRGLVLPWQRGRRSRNTGDDAAAATLREAQAAEFAANEPLRAAALFREAASLAQDRAAAATARLSLARALAKLGRRDSSIREYRQILALGPEVRDPHGIPLAFYAAVRLAPAHGAEVVRRLSRDSHAACCLPPEALYMLRAAADTARAHGLAQSEATRLSETASRAIRDAEQALALQSDFPSLGLRVTDSGANADPRWILFGSRPWFVSVARAPPAQPPLSRDGTQSLPALLVAIDATQTIEAVNRELLAREPSTARLSLPNPSAGVRLLASDLSEIPVLPGASAGAAGSAGNLARSLPLALLLFVLGVTLFAAYLLWFDVRRELRLAELRSQFVSSVSHELKTPLTAIRMFAETMLLDRSDDPGQRREYLATIVNESERLTRLLNNVLDLAKIERGGKTYQLAPVRLQEIVDRCARTMEYPLAQQGFRLQVAADAELPPVAADADALQQALLNLLTNAMKYSGDSRKIGLALYRKNDDAVMEVEDHGIGIPPEHVARLAEKFYRVPTAENARIPGTGLGLTLVDHIAKAHSGRLVVRSRPGGGSTFAIHLPLNGQAE